MPTAMMATAEEAFPEGAERTALLRAKLLPLPVRVQLPLLETRNLPQGLVFLHAPSSLAYEALYSAAARAAMHGVVLWRDAATMFDPRRIARCASRLHVSPSPLLENVRVARSFTVHQFVTQMEALRDSIEEWEPVLVIITGFYTHFEDPDVDRWDVRRLLRRTLLPLAGTGALARPDSLGYDEEGGDEVGFAYTDGRPLRRVPLHRPGVVAGASCPIVLQDRSRPRGLHRLVAPYLALDASYEEVRKGVLARVGDESAVCRPRLPGQTALEEFVMTVEGARADVAQSLEGSRGAERQQARASSPGGGGGPMPGSPVIPPPSIREMV